MPAFVTNGPVIPERLLQAHEEGRVVFFCGAGISYPARLPGFSGLVKRLYEEQGVSPNTIQEAAIKAGQFDTAIGLLEADIVGGRDTVRRAIARILTPDDLSTPSATATHEALLTLGRNRSGRLRLVTTNCDRIFEEVVHRKGQTVEWFTAPLLPVPKERWDGLVYLHGLLPSTPTPNELDRLVVSSGDFGLAYLTERWAARFVSELFRNYSVCFVGYSINDPVLRYMMDALAADRLLGESPPEMFAFGSYSKGKERKASDEWRAKNVTPILYRMHNHHAYLHKTLQAWAKTYQDGVHGKKMIIAQHAGTQPLTSSRPNFAVGCVLWALTDGLAAKHFADLNPVPPLEWLEPLTKAQFGHDDLACFGVVPKSEKDKKPIFSVISRPAPYTHAPRMCIADMGGQVSDWDEVMGHLARWLMRHLGDPKLVLWLSKQGGQLHERFASMVWNRIKELEQLVNDDDQAELERIRAAAPNAIPSRLMRTLWRMFLSGRVKSTADNSDLYCWIKHFPQEGITPTLRMELREVLMPCVILREPFRWGEEPADLHEPKRIKDLVDWELVLSSDLVHATLRDQANNLDLQAALPDLLEDFTVLLRDALDLMRELGGAKDKSDLSYIHQPSISKHTQNRDFRDWTALIDLCRDAWLATVKTNPTKARLVAESWWYVPYPLFKRLAFFAAANSDVIPPRQVLDWLLANNHWWLWSMETEREVIRLLVALTPNWDVPGMTELEQAILQGPPREMFKDDLDPQVWVYIVDRGIWLRLAKAHAAGAIFGHATREKLNELTLQYPDWKLAEDERDEFPVWGGKGDGRHKEHLASIKLREAETVGEVVEWLKEYPRSNHWQEDGWHQRCRDDFPTTSGALSALAHDEEWPTERWREALQVWAEDGLIEHSWCMAQVISKAPDNVIQALPYDLGWWLRAQSNVFSEQEELFFELIQRLLALEYEDVDPTDDPMDRAINHPVGQATEALLQWWHRPELNGSQGIKDEVESLFTQLCDTGIEKFRFGRILLAAHAIELFRVDEDWAKTHLLPLFDWQQSEIEARAAWGGFLWSPRLYRPLLAAIKRPFLETAKHYEQLGTHADQYVAFLTFVALDPGDTFTFKELKEATSTLPAAGLQRAVQAVTDALEISGEQRSKYWCNRVVPYLRSVWPQTSDVRTPTISERFGRLCVAAQEAFPEALEKLQYWLQPVEHPGYLVQLLNKAKLCEMFPSDVLAFLDAVIGDDVLWLPRELKQILEDIENADQKLTNDRRLTRLTELLESHDIS